VVWTSPLQRCSEVGRWLRRWGWCHLVDIRLMELDFGRWEGQPWSQIAPAEVAAWEADFIDHAPGGGESLRTLMARVQRFVQEKADGQPLLIVAHAGWMQALQWQIEEADLPTADRWPKAPRHGELLLVELADQALRS
jgi:alpha-ribazole phosphatase